jgi:hypothetical protein
MNKWDAPIKQPSFSKGYNKEEQSTKSGLPKYPPPKQT